MAFAIVAKAAGLGKQDAFNMASSSSFGGRSFENSMGKAAKLPFAQKLTDGNVEEITLEDIQEIVDHRWVSAPSFIKGGVLSTPLSEFQLRLSGNGRFDNVARGSLRNSNSDGKLGGQRMSASAIHASRGASAACHTGFFSNRLSNNAWASEGSDNSKEKCDDSWLPDDLAADGAAEAEEAEEEDDDANIIDVDWFLNLLSFCLGCNQDTCREVLRKQIDEAGHGTVSREQIAEVLKKPSLRKFLHSLQRDRVDREQSGTVARFLGCVDRQFMEERVAALVVHDEAMSSLLTTGCSLAIIIALIILHLRIWERSQVQMGLQEWLGDEIDDVDDLASFLEWFSESTLEALFSSTRVRGKELRPVLAGRSTLLSDAIVKVIDTTGKSAATPILQSEIAQTFLKSNPGEYVEASRSFLQQKLSNGNWLNDPSEIINLDVTVATYSERARMFALTEVRVPFSDYGRVSAEVVSFAVNGEPYAGPGLFFLDGVYALLLLRQLLLEAKALWKALYHGGIQALRGHYCKKRKLVDMLYLMCGVANVILWTLCYLAVTKNSLRGLLNESSSQLSPKIMSLPTADVMTLHNDLRRCRDWFAMLQMSCGISVISIVLKSLKGFNENKRLQVALHTMSHCAVALIHYSIVFMTVFCCFALISHVLFGTELVMFQTLGCSMYTQSVMLGGEFEWLVEEQASGFRHLPGGLHIGFLEVYFIVFTGLVSLVLINMFMAIVMESYCYAIISFRSQVDVPTLWSDMSRFLRRMRRTQCGDFHKPLYKLGKSNIASTEEMSIDIFVEYLGLGWQQATFLMQWLQGQEKLAQMQARYNFKERTPLEVIDNLLQRISSELHVVSDRITEVKDRFDSVQSNVAKVRRLRPRRARQGKQPDLNMSRANSRASSTTGIELIDNELLTLTSVKSGHRIFKV